jgi:hypothetical protein
MDCLDILIGSLRFGPLSRKQIEKSAGPFYRWPRCSSSRGACHYSSSRLANVKMFRAYFSIYSRGKTLGYRQRRVISRQSAVNVL